MAVIKFLDLPYYQVSQYVLRIIAFSDLLSFVVHINSILAGVSQHSHSTTVLYFSP